jgi:hypothetical protein
MVIRNIAFFGGKIKMKSMDSMMLRSVGAAKKGLVGTCHICASLKNQWLLMLSC